jgi:hypothetical protein
MSELLLRNQHFLNFLLSENGRQQSAVLSLITPEQTDAITEIVHNALILPKSSLEQSEVDKRKQVYNKIGNSKLSYKTRRGLIRKHRILILRLLDLFKERLLEVLTHRH